MLDFVCLIYIYMYIFEELSCMRILREGIKAGTVKNSLGRGPVKKLLIFNFKPY